MSLVGDVSGRYASPFSSSALMSDHRLPSPLYDHESFSHVSLPTSPGGGRGLTPHRGLRLRPPNPSTRPGAAFWRPARSNLEPPPPTPTMITSRRTCATPVPTYCVARGPRPGLRLMR